MQPPDVEIPILPCRFVEATAAFYRRLGFAGGPHQANHDYAILRRAAIELHFFTHRELVPAGSSAGCYFRVADVEAYYRSFSAARLPQTRIPRMVPLKDKPWSLREFTVVNQDGNLLRTGQVVSV